VITDTLADLGDGTYIVNRDNKIENYGDKWSYGYIVGRRPATAEDLTPGTLFGVWTDPDTGLVYVDLVDHIASRDHAIDTGVARNELAIYDLRAREVITL
jgi:hypothetical protein